MNKLPIVLLLLTPTAVLSQHVGVSKDGNAIHQLDSITIQTNNTSDLKRYSDGHSRTEKILDNIPSIYLISRGNYAQEPVIRGMSDGQIMLTINGMHIFGACTDKMDPSTSYIEPSNLEKIDLHTGAAYGIGGSSIGGGLQFHLKEAQHNMRNPWSGSVSTQYETNSHAKILIGQLHYSHKKWAILADGAYRKTNSYIPGGSKSENIARYGNWTSNQVFTVNSKGQINYSQYEKWNVHVNTVYQTTDNGLLKLDYIHDDGNNIGYPALSMDVKYARSNIIGLHYIQSYNNKKIKYWETSIYYSKINHVMDDTQRPLEQLSMHMDMPAWSDTKGAFTQAFWNLTPHQKLKTKIEGYINRWHAEMTMYPKNGGASMYMMTIPDGQRTMLGVDMEDQWHIDNNWKLLLGGHLEYSGSNLFTDAGRQQLSTITAENSNQQRIPYNIYTNIQHRFSDALSSDIYVSRTVRVPTLSEMYALYLFNPLDNYDYIGIPNLKKESAWNIEWQWHYTKTKWSIHLKLYDYLIQNYITGLVVENTDAMTETANGVKQFGNIKHANIAGSEFQFQWHISQNVQFSNSNTYAYGRDNNKRALPLIQSLRSNNNIQWEPQHDFRIYIENLTTVRQNHVSSFYGEKTTPGFAIFNIGADKTFTFKRQSFNIGVDIRNMFNKYYYEHLDIVQFPRIGRNMEARLSYQF
ncbi:MAG: TonB-dependent receptor plug domain-containing protein [Chitinophagaceae bacterium]